MRVLYASASDRVGGAEASLLTLLAALDRSRVEPLVVCPDESDEPGPHPAPASSRRDHASAGPAPVASIDSGDQPARTERFSELVTRLDIPFVRLPLTRLRRTWSPARLMHAMRGIAAGRHAMADLARSHGIDVIHANSLTAALYCDGAPVVGHLRDLVLPRAAVWQAESRVRLWIATSGAVSELAHRRVRRPVRLVPNGVDEERFREGRPDEIGALPYVLMTGHLVPWKRHNLFLECLARVRARYPHVRGIVAGGDLFGDHPDHVERLRAQAADLGLQYAISWVDHVPLERMPALIGGATVLLHPAEREPFGRAVLEAMACATPVVAVASAGPRELLASGGGRLVEPGDVAAMARAVLDYLEHPARAQADGERGRAMVMERYTARTVAEQTVRLYESVEAL